MTPSDLGITFMIGMVIYNAIDWVVEWHKAQSAPAWSKPERRKGPRLQFLRDLGNFGASLSFNKFLIQQFKLREKWDLLLVRSGNPLNWRTDELLFFKELAGLVCAGFVYFYVDSDPLWLLGGAVLGFLLPSLYLSARAAARMAEIKRQLPGLVDLLAPDHGRRPGSFGSD